MKLESFDGVKKKKITAEVASLDNLKGIEMAAKDAAEIEHEELRKSLQKTDKDGFGQKVSKAWSRTWKLGALREYNKTKSEKRAKEQILNDGILSRAQKEEDLKASADTKEGKERSEKAENRKRDWRLKGHTEAELPNLEREYQDSLLKEEQLEENASLAERHADFTYDILDRVNKVESEISEEDEKELIAKGVDKSVIDDAKISLKANTEDYKKKHENLDTQMSKKQYEAFKKYEGDTKNLEQAKEKIRLLISDFATAPDTAKITKEKFESAKESILRGLLYNSEEKVRYSENRFIDNIYKEAVQVREKYLEFKAQGEDVEFDIEMRLGEVRSGVNGEYPKSFLEKIQNSPLSTLVKPEVMAGIEGLTALILQKTLSTLGNTLLPVIGGATVYSTFSSIRKRQEMEGWISRHDRDVAQGNTFDKTRRGDGKIDEVRNEINEITNLHTRSERIIVDLESSLKVIDKLNAQLKEYEEGKKAGKTGSDLKGKEALTTKDVDHLFATLGIIESRKNLELEKNINLTTYSDISKVERERTEIYKGIHTLKAELRKLVEGKTIRKPDGAIVKNGNEDVKDYFKYAQVYFLNKGESSHLKEGDYSIENTISKQSKYLNKKISAHFYKTFALGLIAGTVVHEAYALASDSQLGLFESEPKGSEALEKVETKTGLRSLYDYTFGPSENKVATSVTSTKEVFVDAASDVSERLPNKTIYVEVTDENRYLLDNITDYVGENNNQPNVVCDPLTGEPLNIKMNVYEVPTAKSLTLDGDVVLKDLSVDENGNFTKESLQKMKDFGIDINSSPVEVEKEVTENFTLEEFMDKTRTEDTVTWENIERVEFSNINHDDIEGNELIEYGGMGGFDEEGNIVVSAKSIFGAEHEIFSDHNSFEKAIECGDLRVILSPDCLHQNTIVSLTINENGEVVIPRDSDVYTAFFDKSEGQVSFKGYSMELALRNVGNSGDAQYDIISRSFGDQSMTDDEGNLIGFEETRTILETYNQDTYSYKGKILKEFSGCLETSTSVVATAGVPFLFNQYINKGLEKSIKQKGRESEKVRDIPVKVENIYLNSASVSVPVPGSPLLAWNISKSEIGKVERRDLKIDQIIKKLDRLTKGMDAKTKASLENISKLPDFELTEETDISFLATTSKYTKEQIADSLDKVKTNKKLKRDGMVMVRNPEEITYFQNLKNNKPELNLKIVDVSKIENYSVGNDETLLDIISLMRLVERHNNKSGFLKKLIRRFLGNKKNYKQQNTTS